MKNNVKFIAEVSSNHNRDIDRCFRFIEKAAESGCDAVKFQLFKIDKLFSKEILNKSKIHRDRKVWEQPLSFIPKLSKCAKNNNIEFSCTPFYIEAVKELENYVDFFKIASYELLWKELFIECVKTGKPLVFSTGMSTLSEVEKTLESIKGFKTNDVTVLKCTSAYPTPVTEANLSSLNVLKNKLKKYHNDFNLSYGFSDHTVSPNVINRAVNHYNCDVIEFHLDLEGKGEEFNSGHCWLPDQIKKVIDNLKIDFLADGSGIFGPTESEISDRDWRADPSDGLRPTIKKRKDFEQILYWYCPIWYELWDIK